MSDYGNENREELYSVRVRAGKRTYFFDVKETRGKYLYMTITESKRNFDHDGNVHYQKHKLFLYREDFEKFEDGFIDATDKIKELTPNIPIISEETVDLKIKNTSKIFWLIDPIDGTKEYIAGKDEYTINAALVINKVPVLGLVGAPKKNRLFFSYSPGESYLIEKNKTKTEIKVEKNTATSKRTADPTNNKTDFKLTFGEINKELKRGKVKIDRRLDLHGYTLKEANDKFKDEVIKNYNKNKRCMLVITGKGVLNKSNRKEEDTPKLYYGKIKNSILNWIHDIEIKNLILTYQDAGIEHGGDGAIFIYLRKRKT